LKCYKEFGEIIGKAFYKSEKNSILEVIDYIGDNRDEYTGEICCVIKFLSCFYLFL